MNAVIKQANDVLESTLAAMDSVAAALEVAEHEKVALRKKIAEVELITLQKVAEAKSSIFNPAKLDCLVNKLHGLGVIPQGLQEKVARQLQAQPETALDFVDRITEALISAPTDGYGIAKEGSSRDPDPDGWSDYIAGRPVQRHL